MSSHSISTLAFKIYAYLVPYEDCPITPTSFAQNPTVSLLIAFTFLSQIVLNIFVWAYC